MLNKVILIGRLTKDVDFKYLQSGIPVASFTLAIDRNFKDSNGERGTDFVSVVAWNKTAELCGEYLSKGRQTAVVGRIQTRNYNANDGTKRYIMEVVAEEVVFLGSKEKTAQQAHSEFTNDFEEMAEEDEPF